VPREATPALLLAEMEFRVYTPALAPVQKMPKPCQKFSKSVLMITKLN
jgi:hypothetical protein